MPDYSQGKIYKIHCNITGEDYYGSTSQAYFSSRITTHRKLEDGCSSKQIIERGDYKVEIIEHYPCNNKFELLSRERYYIENFECVNLIIPTRTKNEYSQQHKGDKKIYDNIYYIKNKDKKKERDSQKVVCECGCIVSYCSMTKHKKTQRHLDLMNEN